MLLKSFNLTKLTFAILAGLEENEGKSLQTYFPTRIKVEALFILKNWAISPKNIKRKKNVR